MDESFSIVHCKDQESFAEFMEHRDRRYLSFGGDEEPRSFPAIMVHYETCGCSHCYENIWIITKETFSNLEELKLDDIKGLM